jgi:ABC-type Fe3+/spermidine/putrescine transport system ATPase subunit/ABC-type sulfate transport system permease component
VTRRIPTPLPWLAGLLAIYLAAPLAAGAQQVVLADWSSVDVGALLRACGISVASASVATALIALGGIPLGYLLARRPGRGMAALGFLVQLPLALPPLASGILLLFLVGYSAPLGRLTSGALTDSFLGIVLAEAFVAAPFVIIAARSAFAAADPALEDVAATLGRRPLSIFFRVSLPIAWPAILSGLLLAWLRAFGEFGATVMVAYHPYSLPVYTYVAFGAQGLPAMLPVLLPTLALALTVMLLSGLAGGERKARPAPVWSLQELPRASPTDRATPAAGGADALSFAFERQLNGFHLHLTWSPRARHLAILGPSGSGKSLTLKMIAGIEACDRAALTFNGEDLSRREPAQRAVAYVPQSYGLFPHLTVIEQLRFPLGTDEAAARHWFDRLSLTGLEQRRPAALSLGQQQRVALARALVRPAKLLLLDEPFSALDAPLRTSLRRELRTLQGEFAGTTILVTHDPAEAALLADELLVIENGRVLQAGPTEGVFRRPAGGTVARLLGAERTAEGIAVAADGIAIGGGVTLKVAGPALQPQTRVGWSVTASRVRLGIAGAYQGQVESVTTVGLQHQFVIRLGDALIAAIGDSAAFVGGDICRFDIDPAAIQVWPLDETPS